MLPFVTAAVPIIAAILLLVAALHDIAWRRIPNWIPAALALDGLALRLVHGQFLSGIAAGFAVLLAAGLLWRRGLMGGGDVKLLAASAVLLPASLVLSFIVAVAFAGGILACVYLVLRRIVRPPAARRPRHRLARLLRVEQRRIRACRSLPYAVAIASGALFILAGN